VQILHIVEIFILAIAGKELGLWFPSNIYVLQNTEQQIGKPIIIYLKGFLN